VLVTRNGSVSERDALLSVNFSPSHRSNYLWAFRSRGRWPGINLRVSFTWAIMQGFVTIVGSFISLAS
jgi:hypothetical protein